MKPIDFHGFCKQLKSLLIFSNQSKKKGLTVEEYNLNYEFFQDSDDYPDVAAWAEYHFQGYNLDTHDCMLKSEYEKTHTEI
jgi:hypothetical protein